jgi:hypothetical protein
MAKSIEATPALAKTEQTNVQLDGWELVQMGIGCFKNENEHNVWQIYGF